MKKCFIHLFVFLTLSFCSVFPVYAQVTTTQIVPLNGPTCGRYDKFELGIQLNKTDFINVYDPNEISIEVQFLHPATITSKKVDAFWYKDFQINSNTPDPTNTTNSCGGSHVGVNDPDFMTEVSTLYPWRVRFAPDLLGTWRYRVIVKYNNVTTFTSPYTDFTVTNTGNKGYISIDNNLKKLKYDNHSFLLIGGNIVEKGSVVFNRAAFNIIKDGMAKLSAAGANTVRIWMTPEQLGIEWNEDGLGRYDNRQNRAYLLDELFRFAEQNNIKIQLCLYSNHELHNSPDGAQNGYNYWLNNPNKALLGSAQYDFFGNTQVRNFQKRRLQYVIARYGYSTALLSYELINEYDVVVNSDGMWASGNPAKIKDWHSDLSTYIKSKDSKHLVTTSVALTVSGTATSSSSDNVPIFGIPTLDYVQDHFYNNNLNKDHNLNVISQFSLKKYSKGYITGEIGAKVGWIASSSFHDPDFSVLPAGMHGNGYNDFHNSTWTSLFSGTLGTGLNWSWFDIGNPCWGGAYLQYKPVQLFLQNDYFFDNKVVYIKNRPTGAAGPKDFQDGGVGNNSIPYWLFGNYNIDADISYGIETNRDDSMDVFAAMSSDKIYGWVHNRYNYWYNLPHGSDPANGLNDNTPFVPMLTDKTFTIKNVNCDGRYKVDFYATYPQFDINGDNVQDNGGIIPALSVSGLTAYCGSLTVPVPPLKPLALGNNTLFPDYAFKISKDSDYWNHWSVTGSTNTVSAQLAAYPINSPYIYYNDNNGAIKRVSLNTSTNSFSTENISSTAPITAETSKSILAVNDGNQIFYKGGDSRLQTYYKYNGSWVHDYLTNWSNTSENVGNYIAATNLNVYYQGYNDSRIHRYYYNPGVGVWQHSILPNFGNTAMNISGPIATNANGTQVFYKGADGRLQQYYLDNNTWYHQWLTDWNNTSQNIGGDLTFVHSNSAVYYIGADAKLHVYRYVPASGSWAHNYVLDVSNNQAISIPLNVKIAAYPNEEQIFFTGSNGYITHLWNRDSNKFSVDNMICNTYLNTSMKALNPVVCANNETVYFLGQDQAIHSFAFDNGCISNNGNLMSGSMEFMDVKSSILANENIVNDQYSVKVYPNPFGSSINIDFIYDGEIQVAIYDMWGRMVYNDRLVGRTVNTEHLIKGIYLVKISSAHFSITKKVIKE